MQAYSLTVINDGNGRPVEGATVQWLDGSLVAVTTYATSGGGSPATYATTDAEGLVTRYVPDGTYTVRASYTYAGTPYTKDLPGQQIYDQLEQEGLANRSVLVPSTESNITIPAVASRAGKYLYFDTNGDPQVTTGTAGNYNLTSISSVAIAGSGSKSWTASTGAMTAVGMDYKAVDASNPANYMYGYVTAYNSTTGALTMTITSSGGSGTITNWSITPAASGNVLTLAGGTLSGNLGILGSPSYPLDVTGQGKFSGAVGIGSILLASNLSLSKTMTGATSASSVNITSTAQSDVTSSGFGVNSTLSTAASAFTLTSLVHFRANQGTVGAGSAVTNQYGFYAESSMTGATNNYGYYSSLTAASGRWAFYGAGSAASYFGGNVTFAKSVIETVYTITDGASVDLDPANGGIQTWTLGNNRTATATSFASGQSMVLMVDDGTAYAVTWPTITWVGGAAPTLPTSGYGVIVLWKVGSTLYGKYVGAA